MNKLLLIIALIVLLFATSCKNMDLEGLSMGASETEVMEFIKDNDMKLLPDKGDGYIRAEGDFRLMGFRWDKFYCIIEDGKMMSVAMSCPLENVSDMMLKYINTDFDEKFGEMQSSSKHQMAVFGSRKENKNGFYAFYKIEKYGNIFFLSINDENVSEL